MKKLVVIGLLVSALAACSKKSANTTPSPTPETKSNATAPMGGATYGGAAYGTPAK
jgi:hypothetical protein